MEPGRASRDRSIEKNPPYSGAEIASYCVAAFYFDFLLGGGLHWKTNCLT
jgi:hypothetical protein